MTVMAQADVSCKLVEFDFSGIEAVITGMMLWRHGFSSDGAKQYIRLARLGMHAAVTSLKVNKPVDLTAADADVKHALDAVKKAHPIEYDTSKRTVHANNFGMTTYGMVEKFPEFFPSLKSADEFQRLYYALAPDLPKWHGALRKQARDHGYLGGITQPPMPPSIWDHPYGYRHWFWDVLNYQPASPHTAAKWAKDPQRASRIVYLHGRPFKIAFGGDGNRVIAFYPQSTAAGRLKEVQMVLFDPESDDYIGDCYFGRTPLLGPIHDSLLLHLPNRVFDHVVEIVARVMQQPSTRLPIPLDWGWGPYLPIGVNAKCGRNWAPKITVEDQLKFKTKTGRDLTLNVDGMEDLKLPEWQWIPQEVDDPVLPREEIDQEDWSLLKRDVA